MGNGNEPCGVFPECEWHIYENYEFLRFDPDSTGAGRVGLSRGNKLEQLVWNEFVDTPERLSLVARAIRDGIENDKNLKEIRKVEDVDDGFVIAQEGAILSKLHKVRERNASLVARKKANTLMRLVNWSVKSAGLILIEHTVNEGRAL